MDKEKFALRLSAAGSIFMACLGLGFAVLTKSEAILLDGIFSLTTFIMSLLTLKVAALIKGGESPRFQFGYYNFEPLLNTVKGLTILTVTVFALISSIEAILQGGRELQMGLAVLYAIIATVGCFVVAFTLRRFSKDLNSPLVRIDSYNWMMDGFISSAVAITFVIAFFMKESNWSNFVPYIDPVLVVFIVLLALKIPIKTIQEGINQLLGSSPDHDLEQKVRKHIDKLISEFSFEQAQTRMMLSGRQFYILIQVLVPNTYSLSRVSELDKIREKFHQTVHKLHPGLVMDIMFTEDSQWIK